MNDRQSNDVSRRIAADARRADASRKAPALSPLRGLAVFGMVGWAVAVPTVGGALLGLWLDRRWPASFSWTLTLLVGGAFIGGLLAWRWVSRER